MFPQDPCLLSSQHPSHSIIVASLLALFPHYTTRLYHELPKGSDALSTKYPGPRSEHGTLLAIGEHLLKDASWAPRDTSSSTVPLYLSLSNKNEKFDMHGEVQHGVIVIRRKEEAVFLPLSFRPMASHSVTWNSWLMEGRFIVLVSPPMCLWDP